MTRLLALTALVATLALALPARAAGIQTKGPELFPGKLQIGVTVIGFQAGFTNLSTSGYKLTTDISGLILPVRPGGLWLGGGIDYTAGFFGCYGFAGGGGCGGDVQIWAFLMLTMEKLIPIPLVPFVRAGLGGDIEFYNATVGAFALRFGGGVHYYLFKWLGLGLETNFAFGPGFFGNVNVGSGTGFYGTWDFGLGARFAF